MEILEKIQIFMYSRIKMILNRDDQRSSFLHHLIVSEDKRKGQRCSLMVQGLPSMHVALDSIYSEM